VAKRKKLRFVDFFVQTKYNFLAPTCMAAIYDKLTIHRVIVKSLNENIGMLKW